jgi:hypothetical protein
MTLSLGAGTLAHKQLKKVLMSDFSEKTFINNIDHFTSTPDHKLTYSQRYWVNG